MVEWINKYRPDNFDDVVGHGPQVEALEHALEKGSARAFLFTGESGLGKTTLARIVAKEAGCLSGNILDVDAATNTGIEQMREVTSSLMYRPVGEGKVKAVIIDECHALSKAAWQSLLKVLEEPPPWVYWFLCTTEDKKVPKTVFTRCLHIALKPVPKKQLTVLLEDVAKAEKIKLAPGVLDLCAGEAGGSPRQALSYLAACAAAKNLDDARDLLSSATETAEAIDLARALWQGKKWSEVQGLLKLVKDLNPESVRMTTLGYMTSVALSSNRENDAGRALEIIDIFSQPFYATGNLVLACGKVVFPQD